MMADPKKAANPPCFCGGEIEHKGRPCPYAPVPFYPGRPDLGLIQQQIERGYVHIHIREGKSSMRIEASLASKRARKTWVVAFHLTAPGVPTRTMSKRLPFARVEDEVLSLAIDYHKRSSPESYPKPS